MNEQTNESKPGQASREVMNDLRKLYATKILPVEQACHYKRIGGQPLDHASFNSKPMVLIIGPYSSGKTTFIEHLVGKEVPGSRIGPEPTTDKFVAIYKSDEMEAEAVIPGNTLTVTPNTPFLGLERFGNGFLTRFEGSQVNGSKILDSLTIVDTPGILSGSKQSKGRTYDYQAVMEWFAEKADRIILIFDVQKLDIPDEMAVAINSLSKHYEKCRVILNKADTVSHQDLIKGYGAFMWSLGRVITTPEVTQVYVGSFCDEPLKNEDTKALMEKNMRDLEVDLASLPYMNAVRKVNDLVKRIRAVRSLAIVLDHLSQNMGSKFGFGKEKRKRQMIENLPAILKEVMKLNELVSPGDFPDIEKFKRFLQESDMSTWKYAKKMNQERLEDLQIALKVVMPNLLNRLPALG